MRKFLILFFFLISRAIFAQATAPAYLGDKPSIFFRDTNRNPVAVLAVPGQQLPVRDHPPTVGSQTIIEINSVVYSIPSIMDRRSIIIAIDGSLQKTIWIGVGTTTVAISKGIPISQYFSDSAGSEIPYSIISSETVSVTIVQKGR